MLTGVSLLKVHTKARAQFDFGAKMHEIQPEMVEIGVKAQRLSYKDKRGGGDCIEAEIRWYRLKQNKDRRRYRIHKALNTH